MARWSEDRERWSGGREHDDERRWRGEEGWRNRDWREDERGDDWRAGAWRGGERGEWHGGAREWEGRDRDRDRGGTTGGGEWDRERDWRGGEWRGGERGTEGYGRYGERGGFGLGWRSDEDRYGPGTGRGASFGAGGMYGGTGGGYGGGSSGGGGLGGYRGAFRGGRGWEGSRGDEGGWRDRAWDERDSGFTRDLRRYGDGGGERDDRGPLDRMGDRMREGWRKLTGRGPKGYKRSDERIREEVSERIARSWVNAEDVEVKVENGEVTLTGFVDGRDEKRMIEDLADDVFGVDEVNNHLRIRRGGRGERAESRTFTAGEAQPHGAQAAGTAGAAAPARQGQPQQPASRH